MKVYKTLKSADANLSTDAPWAVELQCRYGVITLSKQLMCMLGPIGSKIEIDMEDVPYAERVVGYAWRLLHKLPTTLYYTKDSEIAADISTVKYILNKYITLNPATKRMAHLTTAMGGILPLVPRLNMLRERFTTNKAICDTVLPLVTNYTDAGVTDLLLKDIYLSHRAYEPLFVEVFKGHIDIKNRPSVDELVSVSKWLTENYEATHTTLGATVFNDMLSDALVDSADPANILDILMSTELLDIYKSKVALKWGDRVLHNYTTDDVMLSPDTLPTLERLIQDINILPFNVGMVWNVAYMVGATNSDDADILAKVARLRSGCIIRGDLATVEAVSVECSRQGYTLPTTAEILVEMSTSDDFEQLPAEVVDPTVVHPTTAELALPSTLDDGMNNVRDCAVATNWEQPASTAPALTLKWELPLALGKTPEMVDLECSMLELHALTYRIRNVYHLAATSCMEHNLTNVALSLVMVYAATRTADVITVWQGHNGLFSDRIEDAYTAELLQELDALLERFRCDVGHIVDVHGDTSPMIRKVISDIRLAEHSDVALWASV